MKRATPSKSAFTLVELLVVIVIICILAALLLPVLSRAKDRARRVACLSNVRNLNLMFISYARDNNDLLPRFTNPNGYYYYPEGIYLTMADYMDLSRMKADAFFDPGMRSWGAYDWKIQEFYRSVKDRATRVSPGVPVWIGYLPVFQLQPGMESTFPDFNWTIVPQPRTAGAVMLPAPNASERVLTAGIIWGDSNWWAASQLWLSPRTNVWELAPPNHPNGRNPRNPATMIPAGENYGMLDGSAKWRKFKDMRKRPVGFRNPQGVVDLSGIYWW